MFCRTDDRQRTVNQKGETEMCRLAQEESGPTVKHAIRILMDGGLIQAVHNVPDDVVLEVYDYDIEGQDLGHPNMKQDEAGHPVFINRWTAADNISAKEAAEGL
jgi:hypothetical protein